MEHTTSNAHSTFQPPFTASQQVQQHLSGVPWHSGMSPYPYTPCALHKPVRRCYGYGEDKIQNRANNISV